MRYVHMDEAWREAISELRIWLEQNEVVARAVLASDVFGRIRVILWGPQDPLDSLRPEIMTRLADAADPWWSGDLWLADTVDSDPVHMLAWNEGIPDSTLSDRLRLLERHRNRGAWFTDFQNPVWQPRGVEQPEGPPVVVFYSFKGGLGRSTALASFAIQQARQGERVAVLDFDLDAPGLGVLLAADADGRTASWGTIDYLMERQNPADLSDYYHPCRRPEVVGKGELLVFPAGHLDSAYPGKLARVDLEPKPDAEDNAIASLLFAIRDKLNPDWILLDARTGLSEPAGALLSGVAHLHVLFGTPSEQSWQGLRVIIERLGARRVARDLPQGDCILVQAMVPADSAAGKAARESFELRARDEFSNDEHGYYAKASDQYWDLADIDTEDAPHVPVPLAYDLKLAHFADVADVADVLAEGPEYLELGERIVARFKETANE